LFSGVSLAARLPFPIPFSKRTTLPVWHGCPFSAEATMFRVLVISILSVCAMLGGCAAQDVGSPNVYQRYDVARAGSLEEVTIVRTRAVTIEVPGADPVGLGSILSAAAGAFLGSRVIGNGNGRYIAGAVSGAAAGVIARGIAVANSRLDGLEIVVRTSTGRLLVVSQPADQQFARGEKVLLVSTNSGLRVPLDLTSQAGASPLQRIAAHVPSKGRALFPCPGVL
jgi:outer membrane lipoprotein SlyB